MQTRGKGSVKELQIRQQNYGSRLSGPCTKCGKQISMGIGSVLSGVFYCRPCVLADVKIQRRLAPETKKKLGIL